MAGNVSGLDPKLAQARQLQANFDAAVKSGDNQKIAETNNAIIQFKSENPEFDWTAIAHANDKPLSPLQKLAKENDKADKDIMAAGLKTLDSEKGNDLANALKAMVLSEKKEVYCLLTDIARAKRENQPTADLEKELDQKMRAAMLRGNGVKSDGIDITGVSSIDTKGQRHQSFTVDIDVRDEEDIEAKMDKPETRQRLSRYYDEKEHKMYEAASASKEDLAAHAQVLKEKEDALEAALKAAKAERKEIEKKKGAITPQESARLNELQEMGEQLKQIKQARQAAEGKGIRKAKGAQHDNSDAETRVSRRQVYMDKEAAKAAVEKGADEDDVRVATEDDMATLEALVLTAANKYENASSAETKAIWRELVELQYEIGEDGKIVTDEKGNFKQKQPIAEVQTRDIQNALADLAGGDFCANYSEREIIADETGRSKQDVRHMFLTYGFDAPAAIGKRLVNGAIAGAPAFAAGMLGLLMKNRAEAHARTVSTADAHAVQRKQGELSVTAEVWQPDKRTEYKDEFGRTRTKIEAGDHVSNTETLVYDIVAEASSHAEAVAEAFAKVAARIPVAAAFLPAAASFLAGFLRNPGECAATKAATKEKLAEFVNMYKGSSSKKLGNQVIQLQKQISDLCGDERFGVAITAAVLERADGSQNTVMTRREIEAAVRMLEGIVEQLKKPQIKVEVPPQVTVEEPSSEVCIDVEEKTVANGTMLKGLKLRTGGYYLSQAYVVDGNNLTEAQRIEVQEKLKTLAKFPDPNNKLDVNLPNEITLDDGTVVKLADNARDRIMKQNAKSGGKDPNYGKGDHSKNQFRGKTCDDSQVGQWRDTEDQAWKDAENFRKKKQQ